MSGHLLHRIKVCGDNAISWNRSFALSNGFVLFLRKITDIRAYVLCYDFTGKKRWKLKISESAKEIKTFQENVYISVLHEIYVLDVSSGRRITTVSLQKGTIINKFAVHNNGIVIITNLSLLVFSQDGTLKNKIPYFIIPRKVYDVLVTQHYIFLCSLENIGFFSWDLESMYEFKHEFKSPQVYDAIIISKDALYINYVFHNVNEFLVASYNNFISTLDEEGSVLIYLLRGNKKSYLTLPNSHFRFVKVVKNKKKIGFYEETKTRQKT